MAKTLQQELDEVDAAITAVLTGQRYRTADGRELERPDYETLCARRDYLQAQIAAESGSSFAQVAARMGRRV